MPVDARRPYIYGDLTWPELDDAALRGPVVVLPVGSMEQHGPHLPLDTDIYPMSRFCLEAAERAPDDILLMETIPYGYNIHACDFPGTIHVSHDTLIAYCADVCRSVAHHGFKAMEISASALTAEALKATMPATSFSRSTEGHNQDKVSMGTIAARDCLRILDLSETVAAIHLLALCQAVDLRRGEGCHARTRALHSAVRAVVRPEVGMRDPHVF